ncbi:ABC transporter permease [Longispora albida]|uniref:ABC transporter permease n=1 Tax=Longispora albida TaxID=203523 RepID=UPI00036EF12F|nr:ABC transporter permease [Longispora albida]
MLARAWAGTWPKVLAVAIVLLVWQIAIWTEFRPPWALASPADTFADLGRSLGDERFWLAVGITMQRAVLGFVLAAGVGLLLGLAVARVKVLRAALGSMITALQTMPSIAWFPLAVLLFGLTENAIMFVVILGATPSVANGVIAGVDYVPPLLLRAGRNIGAKGISLYRHVIAPASLPAIVAGLKQGWAFSWRSLMAGELLVGVANRPSVGTRLTVFRDLNDSAGLIATMIVILVIGLLVDVAFGSADQAIRRRWGITE